MWTEQARPSPEAQRVNALEDQLWELQTEHRLVASEFRGEFMRLLNPAQRFKLVGMIRQRLQTGGRLSPGLDRLDTDRDGRLSTLERQAGMERIQQNRALTQRLRQRLLQRFDANGDGRLDEQERAAARQTLGPAGSQPGQ